LKRQGDKPTGVHRHFEGWQLGLVSVCMAGGALLLALPRGTTPRDLPEPQLDSASVADILRAQTEITQRVRDAPLPFEVRKVGEMFRAYGSATFVPHSDLPRAESDLTSSVEEALRAHGPEPLLALRAVQTELFLSALRRLEAQGSEDQELRELAGDFIEKAKRCRWLDSRGRLLMSTTERSVMFRMRWGNLTQLLRERRFKPSLTEWRLYYRFLLRHPESPAAPESARYAAQQLDYVNALAKLDPDFPADFAAGILLFQSRRYPESMRAFQRHLTVHPEGPWTLRARNFWLGSARLSPQEFD
jgi:hypothetical protein